MSQSYPNGQYQRLIQKTQSVVNNKMDSAAVAKTAVAAIDSQRLSDIVKVLASEEFEGRSLGGPGEPRRLLIWLISFSL